MELAVGHGSKLPTRISARLACGLDRVRLDEDLLAPGGRSRRSTFAGAPSCATSSLQARRRDVLDVADSTADEETAPQIRARLVVGADGGGSRVARAASVTSERNWLGKAGITFHVASDANARPMAATAWTGKFFFGRGWYVGLAPVPATASTSASSSQCGRLRAGVASLTR